MFVAIEYVEGASWLNSTDDMNVCSSSRGVFVLMSW